MKSILFSSLFILFSFALSAQKSNTLEIKKEVAKWTQLYELDSKQQADAEVIQARKFKNLAAIESLRNSNMQLYLKKRQSLNLNTSASLKRILTAEQKESFYKREAKLRSARAEKAKAMTTAGASKEEIQLALLAIE